MKKKKYRLQNPEGWLAGCNRSHANHMAQLQEGVGGGRLPPAPPPSQFTTQVLFHDRRKSVAKTMIASRVFFLEIKLRGRGGVLLVRSFFLH